jgi:peptidyl-prolyl cis-trans isomerase A (cyclophilin A)
VFHRVIDGFMIQGGGYTADLKGKPGVRKAIKNEATNGLSNEPYTIAMAREARPDTATSQWFINVVHNIGLDFPHMQGHGYAVFGKVVKGKEVVDKIRKVVVDDKPGFQNVPVMPITVKTVTILKSAPAGIEVAPPPAPAPEPVPAPAPAEQGAQPVQ